MKCKSGIDGLFVAFFLVRKVYILSIHFVYLISIFIARVRYSFALIRFKSEINSGKLIIHLSHSLSSFYCVNLINLKYPSYYPSSFIAWKIENNVNEQFDRQTMTYLSHDGFVLSIVSLLFLSPSELKTCFTACSISLTCFAVITIIRVDSLSQRLWHLFTCVQALGAHIFFSIRLVSNGFCYFTLSN